MNPDRKAVIAAAIQKANATSAQRLAPEPPPLMLTPLRTIGRINPIVGLGAGLLGMAVRALRSDPLGFGADGDEEWTGLAPNPPEPPEVPKAVARIGEKRAHTEPGMGISAPLEPVASKAPEAPLPPGDTPRFLK